MGILRLNKIILRECNKAFDDVALKTFAGSAIAIDFSIMLHACYSNEYQDLAIATNLVNGPLNDDLLIKRTIKAVLARISRDYVTVGIRPVIILDGEMPELKRKITAPKRRQIKLRAQIRLKELRDRLENEIDIKTSDYNQLIELSCQAKDFPPGMHAAVIDALSSKGYPILRAVGEAEELCTKLCIDGKVAAVFSTDTDNIARRCPILITKIYWDQEDDCAKAKIVRFTPDIYRSLGFNYQQFLDFCIMMGCDYNNRIAGAQEQHIREYLLQYRSIEGIEAGEGISLSDLNYVECRALFAEREVEDCCQDLDGLGLVFPEYR